MARQNSALEITGTIGNLTFYKSQDGYLVKKKTSLSKDKIKTDANFLRTRENMSEFATAAHSSKTLRTPFKNILKQSSDNRMISRLLTLMLKVIQADTVNKRGKRTIISSNLSILDGFDFNNKGLLAVTFGAPYTITYTRTSGDLALSIDAFIPALALAAPQGTTHYKIQLAAAPVDFAAKKNTAQAIESAILPWDNTLTAPLSLDVSLPAASILPVLVLLQVQFMEQVNSDYYALNNGAFNACGIIEIDLPS